MSASLGTVDSRVSLLQGWPTAAQSTAPRSAAALSTAALSTAAHHRRLAERKPFALHRLKSVELRLLFRGEYGSDLRVDFGLVLAEGRTAPVVQVTEQLLPLGPMTQHDRVDLLALSAAEPELPPESRQSPVLHPFGGAGHELVSVRPLLPREQTRAAGQRTQNEHAGENQYARELRSVHHSIPIAP
jgi:hypothetical protein